MPQAVPLAFAFAAAMVENVYLAAALYALSLASSYAISTMMANSAGGSEKMETLGQQVNTCDTQRFVPLIYGRARVGVNKVFIGTSGVDNPYLHIVGALCEGPINGIIQVGGVDQIFLDDRIYTEFGTDVHYEFFSGTSTQTVCTTLNTAIEQWTDPLKYTAYLYVRLKYNPNKFQGVPEITVELEGATVYDPDSETTAYSRNPALCARDFITRSSRRGGMGFAAARIDDTSITDAATYCATKGWNCDLVLNDNGAAIDNFQHVMACFRGALIYSGNKFKVKYKDLYYESVVMALDEDDVVDRSLSIVQPDIFGTPNALCCKYPDEEKNYQISDYVFPDSDAIAADGDYREETVNLAGISEISNVQKMAAYLLERMRINKTATIRTGSRGMALEPMDLVTLTHTRPGWEAKILRVTDARTSYEGEVAVGFEEEYASFYDDAYNAQAHSYHDTTLPNPSDTIYPVINVTMTEDVYDYRGRSFTRLKINFDPPAENEYPWWDGADVYVSMDAGATWKYMTRSYSDYVIDPVEEGQTYYCMLASCNIWGGKQADADAYVISKPVLGKTVIPDDLASLNATAHGDSVVIMATELTDPDVAGYEVRLGGAWAGGLYIGFNETPNVRLAGVRPGTHTFWMNPKDNGGHYADNPVSAQVIVYYPAGYADKNTWSWDFDSIGTHDNTEHCTYDGGDALKCSHTSDVLTGTWLSPEYDLGSVKTVRVWGDFVTAFSAGSLTWANLFPATWGDKITATTKWYELLSAAGAGQIKATLYWGTSSGSLTSSAEKFEILAPEINARYVQVEITLIDPDLGSNLYLKELNMIAAYWS